MAESRGTLEITVLTAEGGILEGATVILTGISRGSMTEISNREGFAAFSIPTGAVTNSLTPNPRERPYVTVDIRIVLRGFITVSIIGEQIFPNQTTKQTVRMEALTATPNELEKIIIIPEHQLYTNRKEVRLPEEDALPAAVTEQPRQVVVPETIRVHLGPPGANVKTVTVPFIDYIKNVASSEIYPNWPTNSLIANVIAQVSLALNRLYTEWYPSQGYNFDITSSTAYDQYYVHERGIFEAIDTVVDGYFTNYISVKRRLEPLFAEYCDGATTTCDGMSQWGTVSLARKNYTPLQILQYYYGTDIELRTASVQQTVAESFPGTLSLGAVSEGVLRLQNRLNRVAIAFPSIPFVIPADGRFGDSTALAVRAFQRLFRLAETGQVDRETWYRIQYIYTAVKKLAELGSEGEFPQTDAFPGRPLQSGSRGTEVLRIQRYLEYISRELGADVVPAVEVDGVYGDETAEAVRLFQNYYGLVQTGTVNEATWNAIVTSFYALGGGETDTLRPYPGTPLRRGATGEDVRWLQTMLNAVSTVDLDMPMLTVDGIFGPATEANVRRYQRNYGLAEDGIAGPLTWESLTKEYARITGVS
ncbi:MAG: peptidoglycan-binding protein [Clostridia bacterium]|nr:peptidoglycan-binding protein [Clostridia bacterium]